MSELGKKVDAAIKRLKSLESIADNHADDGTQGYYLAFSGGKDSVTVKALMDMAGVKYDAHYRITSVDPPELVQFIKREHKDVSMEKPRYSARYRNEELADQQITMWNLIRHKLMPPTRRARYCCQYLKEDGGDGRFTVTGVRWAESVNRAKNQGEVTIISKEAAKELADDNNFTETEKGGVILANDNAESRAVIDACVTRHKTCLNPIIDWSDAEVWEFIHAENVPYCGLYDEGWHRLGCIGCPMARKHGREREFARWPKYKEQYIKSFDKMLNYRRELGKVNDFRSKWGTTGQDVFNWWMEYDILPGQSSLFEGEEYE